MAKKTQPTQQQVNEAELAEINQEMKKTLRLEWRDPTTLAPHDLNLRTHPIQQRRLLREFRNEVEKDLKGEGGTASWFGALLFNERTGRLLDGHMRQQDAIEQAEETVPVLVIDVPAEVELKILRYLDLVGSFFTADERMVSVLDDQIEVESELLRQLAEGDDGEDGEEISTAPDEKALPAQTATGIQLSLNAGVQLNYITLIFRTEMDWTAGRDHFGIVKRRSPWSSKIAVGHVVDGTRYLAKIKAFEERLALYEIAEEAELEVELDDVLDVDE